MTCDRCLFTTVVTVSSALSSHDSLSSVPPLTIPSVTQHSAANRQLVMGAFFRYGHGFRAISARTQIIACLPLSDIFCHSLQFSVRPGKWQLKNLNCNQTPLLSISYEAVRPIVHLYSRMAILNHYTDP